MLLVTDFEKKYGDELILTIKRAMFEKGVCWIKGENGSGKSTLFKSAAGLIPFIGNIQFEDGVNLRSHNVEFRRRIGFSEAEPMFPGFITGKELFMFISKAKGATKDDMKYYENLLGIGSYFSKPCGTYSSGMLKKLSLTLAFLGKPSVIILDEPLITLDKQSCGKLLTEIERKVSADQTLFLVSSHQLFQSTTIDITSFTIENKKLARL